MYDLIVFQGLAMCVTMVCVIATLTVLSKTQLNQENSLVPNSTTVPPGVTQSACSDIQEGGIHIAACLGNVFALKKLFKLGGNCVDDTDAHNKTALYYAVENQKVGTVSYLLQMGANANEGITSEYYPLFTSLIKGYDDISRKLLKYGADINMKDDNNQTFLYKAAERGNVKMLEHLLHLGAEPDVMSSEKVSCSVSVCLWSPLFIASYVGHLEVVNMLLSNRSNAVNKRDNNQQTPLFIAARNSKGKIVNLLIEKGAQVNARDKTMSTALHSTPTRKVADILLKHGADIDAENVIGNTALIKNLVYDNFIMVKYFLNNNASIDINGERDNNLLYLALNSGNTDIVRMILERGAEIVEVNRGRYNTLHRAVFLELVDIIRVLLEHGANLDIRNSKFHTPLMALCKKFYVMAETVKFLLENNANVNAKDREQRTALHWAVNSNNSDIVKLLLNYSAEIDAADNNHQTPLFWASTYGHEEIVKVLLTGGADMDARDSFGKSPLHAAASKNHLEVAKLLLINSANVNALNRYKCSPLYFAAEDGYPNMITLLVEHGANLNQADERGRTPLFMSCYKGHLKAVEQLLNLSDVQIALKVRNSDRQTVLHAASMRNHTEIIKILLTHGAEVDAVDIDRNTPLILAVIKGYKQVALILLDNGASVNSVNIRRLTPLAIAVQFKHRNLIGLLSKRGGRYI